MMSSTSVGCCLILCFLWLWLKITQIIAVLMKLTVFLAQMSEHFFRWITQNTSRIHLKMKMKGVVGR